MTRLFAILGGLLLMMGSHSRSESLFYYFRRSSFWRIYYPRDSLSTMRDGLSVQVYGVSSQITPSPFAPPCVVVP